MRPERAFRREICSTSNCFSSTIHEYPTRRRISISIKKLASLAETRGYAFHDAVNPLRFGGVVSDRCERCLLESTHSDQASDAAVALPTRTSAVAKDEREPVRKRRRSFAIRRREKPYCLRPAVPSVVGPATLGVSRNLVTKEATLTRDCGAVFDWALPPNEKAMDCVVWWEPR